MRLAIKQTILITILVSVILTIGSIVMVQRSFTSSLETAVNRSIEQQMLDHYALKSFLLTDLYNGIAYSDDTVERYVKRMTGGENKLGRVGIYDADGEVFFTDLPLGITQEDFKILLKTNNSKYILRKINTKYFCLMSAQIQLNEPMLYMINAYDMSYIFEEKQAQIQSHFMLNICLVAVSGMAIAALSFALTRPLLKLNKVSKDIANGAYGQRTRIASKDEIGQLSLSFDRMADAVEQNIIELNEQVDNRDRFIAAFSHEIKTPVTSIMGYADMMRQSPMDQEQQLRYASILYQESKRVEAMSQKMMMLLNITSDGISVQSIPIESFIKKLWISRKTSFPNVEFIQMVENANVLAEPDLLFSLISNLLDNARKAEPKDNIIRLNGRVEGTKYMIEIRDHGVGIPSEDIPHIQEMFYMADKSRSRASGGAGIGLYLCSKIAQMHGSELKIESTPDIGTCVSFCLEVCHE